MNPGFFSPQAHVAGITFCFINPILKLFLKTKVPAVKVFRGPGTLHMKHGYGSLKHVLIRPPACLCRKTHSKNCAARLRICGRQSSAMLGDYTIGESEAHAVTFSFGSEEGNEDAC